MTNVKFTYTAATLLSLTSVANNISASNTFTDLKYAAAPAISISFTTEIVPTRSLVNESVTMADSSFVLEVTKAPGDTLTFSDSTAMNVDIAKTDSVNITDTPNKIINSSVDFDLSDADVDPDPITIAESDAKTLTKPNITDAATISDSPSKQPNKFPTDSVTMAEAFGPFTIGKNPSDTLSVTESDAKTITPGGKTSGVTMAESTAKTMTPAGKTDSISVADVPVKNITPADKTDSVTMAESFGPFTIGVNPTDSVTAAESISTTLTLGETTRLYPTRISAFDGAETGKVKGFHIGNSNEVSRVADVSFLLNEGFSAVNEKFLGGASDTVRHYNRVFNQDVKEFTGLLNGDGYIGQPIVNSDTITYGELTNAGLLVNFIYTDTSDSPTTGSHAVNGHFFNETPMGAGSH